jgi:hypothetical protein|tara:strand:- start:960 stop:1205 length:246 start_codon:yes stop_codon:yes gene_type:complete
MDILKAKKIAYDLIEVDGFQEKPRATIEDRSDAFATIEAAREHAMADTSGEEVLFTLAKVLLDDHHEHDEIADELMDDFGL